MKNVEKQEGVEDRHIKRGRGKSGDDFNHDDPQPPSTKRLSLVAPLRKYLVKRAKSVHENAEVVEPRCDVQWSLPLNKSIVPVLAPNPGRHGGNIGQS